MSTEIVDQILEQMNSLRPQDLRLIEMHAGTLRRTHIVQIGKTYEVSEFPKGELAAKAIAQIRILEGESILYAKGIYESGTLTCLIDDNDKRRALQALAGMDCLVVETDRW